MEKSWLSEMPVVEVVRRMRVPIRRQRVGQTIDQRLAPETAQKLDCCHVEKLCGLEAPLRTVAHFGKLQHPWVNPTSPVTDMKTLTIHVFYKSKQLLAARGQECQRRDRPLLGGKGVRIVQQLWRCWISVLTSGYEEGGEC